MNIYVHNLGWCGVLSHFKENVNINAIVNGCNNEKNVANKFAAHSKDVFNNSHDDSLSKATYESVGASAISSNNNEQQIAYVDDVSVELIARCVNDHMLNKPCGPRQLRIFVTHNLLFS